MKICSLWKIEFVVTQGANAGWTYTLLDFEDKQEENEPQFSPSQGNAASTAIDFSHGSNYALGGTQTQLTWTRWRTYDEPQHGRAIAQHEIATFPFGQQGFIRMTIEDGAVWEYESSVVISPVPSYVQYDLLMTYTAQLGKGTYISGALPNGMPANPEYMTIANSPNIETITTNPENIWTLAVI